MKWSAKAAIFALVTGGWLTWGSMNYSGYCFEQSKYLSNEERIRSVIEELLEDYPPITQYSETGIGPGGVTTSLFRKMPANPIPYSGVDEFLKENPACCELRPYGTEGYAPSAWERFTGGTSGFVFFEYSVKFIDRYGAHRSEKINESMPVSNCGRVR